MGSADPDRDDRGLACRPVAPQDDDLGGAGRTGRTATWGRRADVLEAATRCARALSSSLDLNEAFEAFIRELRGFVPFDRMAIVLEEAGTAQVLAVAGVGAEVVFSRGSRQPVGQTLLDEILRTG